MGHFYSDEKLYLYGGRDNDRFYNDLYYINLESDYISKILTYGISPNLSNPFFYYKGEEEFMVLGGLNEQGLNTKTFVYHLKNSTWSIFNPTIENPVHYHGSAIRFKASLYLFGGFKDSYKNKFNDKVDVLEIDNVLELNVPPIFNGYSKWFRMQSPENSDVLFYFGMEQKKIYAHKFMIEITCPKLYQYILEAEKRKKSMDEITEVYEIFDQKVYFNVFGTFIEFLYTFSLNIDPKVWNKERFEMLLYLSRKFDCKILEESIIGKLEYETIIKNYLPFQIEKNIMSFITGQRFGDNLPSPGNGIIHFIFEDGPLYAHKGLLMNRSSYFNVMFETKGFQESESGIVEMPQDVSKQSMISILEYLYLGKKPHVSVSDAVGLYYAISIYDIPELKPYLRSIISGNVTIENVYDILYIADMLKDDYLNQLCATCLFKNYEEVKDTEEFKNVAVGVKSIVFDRISKHSKKHVKKQK